MEKMFTSIPETARITGISQKAIRKGCVEDRILHIMIGVKYMINLQEYIRVLQMASEASVRR